METLLRAGLSNAVAATLMAMLVTALSRPLSRRPAILHGLWLLVLIKLVTPPLFDIPIPWPISTTAAEPVPFTVALVEIDSVADVDGRDDPEASEVVEPGVLALSTESPRQTLLAQVETDRSPSFFGLDVGGVCRCLGLAWMVGSRSSCWSRSVGSDASDGCSTRPVAAPGSNRNGSTTRPAGWGSDGALTCGGFPARSRP